MEMIDGDDEQPSEMTQGDSPTDVSIADDEPELHLPGPRSIPVEVVNVVERVPNQASMCRSLALAQGQVTQILNADPLRAVAQITALGASPGVIWITHSLSEANAIASFAETVTDDLSGFPVVQGMTVPYTSTGPLYAVAGGGSMLVGILQERRQ